MRARSDSAGIGLSILPEQSGRAFVPSLSRKANIVKAPRWRTLASARLYFCDTIFKRLAERFEDVAAALGQLVEKKHLDGTSPEDTPRRDQQILDLTALLAGRVPYAPGNLPAMTLAEAIQTTCIHRSA
jgi:hypothetical protein